MRVADLMEKLEKQKQELTEKYCDYCQEWTCEYCQKEVEGEEHD